MNGYQERVIKEQENLASKIDKLVTFRENNDLWLTMDVVDQTLLKDQLVVMNKYNAILETRIVRFK